MYRPLVVALALAALSASGCNKPRKVVLTKQQSEQIQQSILSEAPTPQKPIGAVFDGGIELIGVDLSAATVKAGESFDVTWYWKAGQTSADAGWKLFVHFEAPGKRRTTHDHHAIGELHPIARWEPGQIIKDVQRISVPKDFPNGEAKLYVGVFDEKAYRERQQNVRMTVTNADPSKVVLDGDGRLLGGVITVEGSTAPAAGKKAEAARRHAAPKATGPITIDGKLDEESWRRARPTQPFVQPHGQRLEPRYLTQARMTWDDQHLYVAFVSRDDDIWNDQTGRDATLWKQDVVEIYLDPGEDGRDYVELQVSPTGEIFDAHFSTRRQPDWPEAARRLTLSGMKVAIDAQGSVNSRDGDADKMWTAEIAIPWAELPGVEGAPAVGATWGVNFYRIDVASPSRGGFMGAWAPAGGDFHNTAAFGKVSFVENTPRAAIRGRVSQDGPKGDDEPEGEAPAEPKSGTVAPGEGQGEEKAPAGEAPSAPTP